MSDLVTTLMGALGCQRGSILGPDTCRRHSHMTLDGPVNTGWPCPVAERVEAALVDDPAALLDALVSAGVLHEETDAESGCDWRCPEWSYYLGERCGHTCRHYGGNHSGPHECVNGHTVERGPGDPPARTLRRYLTEWEVLP